MTVTILKANKKSIYIYTLFNTNIYWLTFMCQALSWILKLCKSAKQAVLHFLTAFMHISMNNLQIGLLSVLFFYSRLFNKVDWDFPHRCWQLSGLFSSLVPLSRKHHGLGGSVRDGWRKEECCHLSRSEA